MTKPFRLSLLPLTALAVTFAAPARADVKDGVDAWSRGDYAAAIAEWRGPAAAGDPDAQFNLAQAYRLGRGVNADLPQAETLYSAAAAQGHLRAADTYGLVLFQSGRRELALPYVQAASRRGDPRAQYLLGVAHFNGELVARDWVRAYALLTLANGEGLPQATPALAEMDQYIPIEQRREGAALAERLRAETRAARTRELAAADLVRQGTGIAAYDAPSASPAVPRPIENASTAPSIASAEAAIAEAQRVTGTESPATAGADFARPAAPGVSATAPNPTPNTTPAASRSPTPTAVTASEQGTAAVAAPGGDWKVQLGAFSVRANAERLRDRWSGNAALSGASWSLEPAGRVTKVLATGFASRTNAEAACATLKRAGQDCLVVR